MHESLVRLTNTLTELSADSLLPEVRLDGDGNSNGREFLFTNEKRRLDADSVRVRNSTDVLCQGTPQENVSRPGQLIYWPKELLPRQSD